MAKSKSPKEYMRAWRDANRDKILGYRKEWVKNNRHTLKQQQQRNKFKVKFEVFRAYGNCCQCCGETTREFLTLDHINGGGSAHRREKHVLGIFRQIRAEGFPKDKYRILCYNCNCALGAFGYCPHQRLNGNKLASEPLHEFFVSLAC